MATKMDVDTKVEDRKITNVDMIAWLNQMKTSVVGTSSDSNARMCDAIVAVIQSLPSKAEIHGQKRKRNEKATTSKRSRATDETKVPVQTTKQPAATKCKCGRRKQKSLYGNIVCPACDICGLCGSEDLDRAEDRCRQCFPK